MEGVGGGSAVTSGVLSVPVLFAPPRSQLQEDIRPSHDGEWE